MGFDIFGTHDSSSTSTNTQNNRTKNQGNQGVSGQAIAGRGNTINVAPTDLGAIAGGLTLGNNALKVGQNSLLANLQFADATNGRALDFADATSGRAFAFGRDALNAMRESESGAIDAALEALHIGTGANQRAFSNYTDQVNRLVQQTGASNDARVQQMAKYLVIAAVVVVVAPAFFGRKK